MRRKYPPLRSTFAFLLIGCVITHSVKATAVDDVVLQKPMVRIEINRGNVDAKLSNLIQRYTARMPRGFRAVLPRLLSHKQVERITLNYDTIEISTSVPLLRIETNSDWTESDLQKVTEKTSLQAKSFGKVSMIAVTSSILPESAKHDAQPDPPSNGSEIAIRLTISLDQNQRRVISELGPPSGSLSTLLDEVTWPQLERFLISSVANPENEPTALLVLANSRSAQQLADHLKESSKVFKDLVVERDADGRSMIAAVVDAAALSDLVPPRFDQMTRKDRNQLIASKLRRIGLAMHNYHSAYGKLPPIAVKDDKQKPLLSWRLRVLPFLGAEHAKLYHRFHMDEPWDSEHNQSLISEMPDAFRVGNAGDSIGQSDIQIPFGKRLFFHDDGGAFRDVTDGLSNTIMAVVVSEVGEGPWTKPGEGVSLETIKKPGSLVGDAPGRAMVLMGDGSTRSIDVSKWTKELEGLFARDDGR